MPGLYTGATGLWGGFPGLLFGSTSLSTPPGLLADAATAFSPASLFAAGEQGVWYDPSDFSTMFQDSAGTIPVTAVEQPVGLLLDKSKGLTLGSELVTNGNFSSGTTGWTASGSTIAVVSGEMELTASVSFGAFYGSITTVAGRTYKATAIARRGTAAGSVNFVARTSPTSGNLAFAISSSTSNTTLTFYFTAAGTTTFINCTTETSGTSYWDNISVQEIAGNHATQPTTTPPSRPVLSARVNQLLATATLATQSVTTLAATYTLAFSGAGTVTTSGTNIGVYSAGTHSITCTAGTLTLTVVGAVTLADLRVANTGVGLPAYQAVVTSTNYDTTGFPYYLRFDGTDDSMATATITPGIDKVQVFAGVRKLSDAAIGMLVEFSTNAGSLGGSFYVVAPLTPSFAYEALSRGFGGPVGLVSVAASSYPAPITNVLSSLGDISGDLLTLRLNGVQAAQSASDQGSGNFSTYPLYIGSRAGSSLRFNGNLYSLIVRFGANLDATTITNTETWVNGKTYAYA